RSASGRGPLYAEVALCCGQSKAECLETAHRYFRWSATGWPVQAELPDTKGFEAASQYVRKEDMTELVSCGPRIEDHASTIKRYVDAGFDHIILVQVGPHQKALFERVREIRAAIGAF